MLNIHYRIIMSQELEICDCKVGRVAQNYEILEIDQMLLNRRRQDNKSLRSLADCFNTNVLRAALRSTNADIAGDPKSVYEALTGDVSPERRADVADQLEYVGIDVENLKGDFVSHQTIKSHLTNCLDVDTSRQTIQSIEEATGKIEWARQRNEGIINSILGQLDRNEFLEVGDLEIAHSITVACTNCNQTYSISQLLDNGGCNCNSKKEMG